MRGCRKKLFTIHSRTVIVLNRSLTHRTLGALTWSSGGILAKYISRFAIIVVLARLLPPEAFGAVGTATVLIGLVRVLLRQGFSSAIVQQKDLEAQHIHLVFVLNVAVGMVCGGLLWLSASWIAAVFAMPELADILRLLSVHPLLTAFSSSCDALLQRRMAFQELFAIEVSTFVVGYSFVGVPLALLGFGLWALAWAVTAQICMQAAALWWRAPHTIGLRFSAQASREIFAYGFSGLVARLAYWGAQNAAYLMVAKFLGAGPLGLYSRAYQFMAAVVNLFSTSAGRVLFPSLSEIQGQPERLRRAYCGSLAMGSLVSFPVLAVLAVLSPELIRFVFGPAWEASAPALQILTFAAAALSVHTTADSVARAKGATVARTSRDSWYLLAVVAASAAGAQWGIVGVAAGVSAACLVPYFLSARLAARLVGVTWTAFFRAQTDGLALAALAGAPGYATAEWLRSTGSSDGLILVLVGFVSGSILLTAPFVYPRAWIGDSAAWAVARLQTYCQDRFPGLRR